MQNITATLLTAPLVPVRETQKNITKYFKGGIARVTKNGRSLGYLMSDKMMQKLMEELVEDWEASQPDFIAEIERISQTEKTVPLEKVLKEYQIK